MSAPYAVLSDIHAHSWSAFASTDPDGVNSRLRIILNEMERAADELVAAGGKVMVLAGDLFHVRGKIEPEVFNPTQAAIKSMVDKGVSIVAIPGNHDLQGRDTTRIGNALQTLNDLRGFLVADEACWTQLHGPRLALFPWRATLDQLRDDMARKAAELNARADLGAANFDAIIHAPVNEVIAGLPDHGFDPAELAGFGFRRVFSGHYHNHKQMLGGKVISVGATTHQTWGDIGTKAGFLLVYPDRVVYRASHAPSFVEVTAETDPADIPLMVDGHYVRVRLEIANDKQVAEIREELTGYGAKGVIVHAARAATTTRTGASVKSGETLEGSVGAFIHTLSHPREAEITALCADILNEARATAS